MSRPRSISCYGCRSAIFHQGRAGWKMYCHSCRNYIASLRPLIQKVLGPFPKDAPPCMDCGKKSTCRDHRDYSFIDRVDFVCQGCNVRRGPGKLPEDAIKASRQWYLDNRAAAIIKDYEAGYEKYCLRFRYKTTHKIVNQIIAAHLEQKNDQ